MSDLKSSFFFFSSNGAVTNGHSSEGPSVSNNFFESLKMTHVNNKQQM